MAAINGGDPNPGMILHVVTQYQFFWLVVDLHVFVMTFFLASFFSCFLNCHE